MGSGNQELAYGAVVNLFHPQANYYPYGQQFQGPGFTINSLNRSTDQLVQELRQSNPGMREISAREDMSVDGARALSTRLTNNSPIGGRETDWLVAVQHREGVVYFLFTAPEREFPSYESNVFQRMLNSVQITS